MANKPHILLKWGTLKSWSGLTPANLAVCEKYDDLSISMSAVMQDINNRHMEWLCELIDSVWSEGGKITNDWSGVDMTPEQARKYVTEYDN